MVELKCNNCGAMVPVDHKFCGRCGAATPGPEAAAPVRRTTRPFSELMAPGRARITVLKGTQDTFPGMTFHLGATHHVLGRHEGELLFEEDNLISSPHADFFYEETSGKLMVEDKGSVNGSYIRLRGPHRLRAGDVFLVGQQVLRFEYLEVSERYPAADGTLQYVSPMRPYRFRLIQILPGGHDGQILSSPTNEVIIGRQGSDMAFDEDVHLSERHARVYLDDKGVMLEDLDSSNGTYVRLRQAQALEHGDHLFVGQQLLRVEFNP